jgi:Ulp1 family protease
LAYSDNVYGIGCSEQNNSVTFSQKREEAKSNSGTDAEDYKGSHGTYRDRNADGTGEIHDLIPRYESQFVAGSSKVICLSHNILQTILKLSQTGNDVDDEDARNPLSERLISSKVEKAFIELLKRSLPSSAILYLQQLPALYEPYEAVEIRGDQVQMKMLRKLLTNEWLPESVIDVYIKSLLEYDQSLYSIVRANECREFGWFSDKTLESIEPLRALILMPVCRNDHWILTKISQNEQQITIYDSLSGNKSTSHYKEHYLEGVIYQLRMKYSVDIADWKIDLGKSEKQNDSHSCGVFVARKMKAFITSSKMLTFDDYSHERYKLLWEILFGLI